MNFETVTAFLTDSPGRMALTLSLSLFVTLAVLEAIFPRKRRTMPRLKRWTTNILFIIIGSVATRLMGPIVALGAAGFAVHQGIGLFNWISLPMWLEFVCALVLLDLALYFQHVISHKVPVFWAIHKVHHADRDIDVTTALRFHPLELVLSMLYKCVVVILIGPSVFVVFIFTIILNLCAMFNHSNLGLPLWLDRILRLILVTPDMHRVHHSAVRGETNSNYGFSIAMWDRIFGTYIAQPAAGHDGVTIGLMGYQTTEPTKLWWSLKLPFQ